VFFTCLARSKNAARAATKRSEDDLSDDEGDMGVFDDDGTAAQQDDDADDDAFFDWYVLGMHLQVVASLTIPLRWCCFYPGMTMWTCERACCVWVCCQSTRHLEQYPRAITPSEHLQQLLACALTLSAQSPSNHTIQRGGATTHAAYST